MLKEHFGYARPYRHIIFKITYSTSITLKLHATNILPKGVRKYNTTNQTKIPYTIALQKFAARGQFDAFLSAFANQTHLTYARSHNWNVQSKNKIAIQWWTSTTAILADGTYQRPPALLYSLSDMRSSYSFADVTWETKEVVM